MANKVDDVHYKVNDVHDKVEDIHTILFKLNRSGTRSVSDTLTRQEMPLKPEVFHGRADFVERIAQLFLLEEPLASAFWAQVGWGRLRFRLPSSNCLS